MGWIQKCPADPIGIRVRGDCHKSGCQEPRCHVPSPTLKPGPSLGKAFSILAPLDLRCLVWVCLWSFCQWDSCYHLLVCPFTELRAPWGHNCVLSTFRSLAMLSVRVHRELAPGAHCVEFWNFPLTCSCLFSDQDGFPDAPSAGHREDSYHGPQPQLLPSLGQPAIRCLRPTPGWEGGLVGVALSTFWPRWTKAKLSDQVPFSSMPGTAALADHAGPEHLPSREDKADKIVQETFPATGQCSSLQYDLKVITSQPQFPSL